MTNLFTLCILTLFPHLISAYALPETCTGICVNTHDPAIIRRADGTYFRFSTGGKIAVHTAPDLTGPWTYKGAAISNGSQINLAGRQDLWAPDVAHIDSQYYLFYSVSTFGSQTSAIGVARSPTMDVGSWTDLGSTGVVSDAKKPFNAIDPSVVDVFGNGTWYLTFGSWWNGLYQVRLQTPPVAVEDEGPGGYVQLSYDGADKAQEGASLVKIGERWYLFYSKGSCCGYDRNRPARGKEYRILVCRSERAGGGFVDKAGRACVGGGGSVVLESHAWVYGPGGQGVYLDPNYGPVLYYHYVDTRVGYGDGQKRFGWNKLDFSSGWPTV